MSFPGRDASVHCVFGDANAIVERIAQYVQQGASKFILRPLAKGDDDVLARPPHLRTAGTPTMIESATVTPRIPPAPFSPRASSSRK